jgi:hypothetical protein
VMQFIEGDDLAQMMTQKQGPFPPEQVLTWGDQLLDALDYLHTQDPQIIHRDIKPQNLKLTSRGQIILLDFGLAKGQAGGMSLVTTSASIFGYTPNYAPLEQIQGLGTDARSDIYALSATLYHLMTSVKPPDALTRAAALVNGQPDPLKPASEISAIIGPEVSNILARGMSQNREQRLATAAAMRAALKETGEGATLSDRAEAATVIFQPPAARVVDPARAVAKQAEAKTGETTVVQAPRSARRRVAPLAIATAALVLVGVMFGVFYAYQHRRNSTAATTPNNAGNDQTSASPAAADPSSGPANGAKGPNAGTLLEEKKTDTPMQRADVNGPTKKNEKPAINTAKIAEKPPHAGHPAASPGVADRSSMPENIPAEPAVPRMDADPARVGGQRVQRMGGASIRNFPDGRQVITSPDGTRVVIFPDGTRRVFRPGARVDRRKGLRY